MSFSLFNNSIQFCATIVIKISRTSLTATWSWSSVSFSDSIYIFLKKLPLVLLFPFWIKKKLQNKKKQHNFYRGDLDYVSMYSTTHSSLKILLHLYFILCLNKKTLSYGWKINLICWICLCCKSNDQEEDCSKNKL